MESVIVSDCICCTNATTEQLEKKKQRKTEKQKKTLERVLVFQFPLALLPERPQTHNRGITFNAHEMASGNDGLYNQQERSTQYRYILTGLKSDRIYITKKDY